MEEGAHFGEIALVMESTKRIATVIATEICEICEISRSDFKKSIAVYPYLLSRLQKVALERMKTTLDLEEAYDKNGEDLDTVNISLIKADRTSIDLTSNAFNYIST